MNHRGASREQLVYARRRRKEIAEENKVRRHEIAAGLLADLGRPPNTTDRLHADHLAALTIKADNLENAGRDSTEVRRQIGIALKASGFRPAPPAPAESSNGLEIVAFGKHS